MVYVKEQLGHGSIQITVDTYGHLIPGPIVARSIGSTTPTRRNHMQPRRNLLRTSMRSMRPMALIC